MRIRVALFLVVAFAVEVACLHAQVKLTPVVVIGELDGRPATTFGKIESVVVDADGRIYVLDSMAQEIRVFDAEGMHLQTVGRMGGGPGEFQEPRGLTILGSQLLVLDARQMRITSYELADSLAYLDETRIDIYGMDMCALDDRLFILGFSVDDLADLRADTLVHEFSLQCDEAVHLSAFGESFSDHPVLSRTLASGIECLESINAVAVFSRELGRATAYSPEGELTWRYVPEEWEQIGLEGNLDGSATWSCPESGSYEYLMGLASVRADEVTLQVAPGDCLAHKSPDESTEVEWRTVDAARGELWRQETGCRVMAVRSDTVYCAAQDPYPRIAVMQVRK